MARENYPLKLEPEEEDKGIRYTAIPRSYNSTVSLSFEEARVFDDEIRNSPGGREDGRKSRYTGKRTK